MIYVLYSPASQQQIRDMLEPGTSTVKVVVDVRLGILAGGGELHSDCEAALLAEGCQQADLWGASWNLITLTTDFESIINIRAQQKNYSPVLRDPAARACLAAIIKDLLGGI